MQVINKIDINRFDSWKANRTKEEIDFITDKYNKIYLVDVDIVSNYMSSTDTVAVEIVNNNKKIFKHKSLYVKVLLVRDEQHLLRLIFELIIDYILKEYNKELLLIRKSSLLSDFKKLIGGKENE